VSRLFTLDEARKELPRVLAVADEVIELRARLINAATLHQHGEAVSLADLKADEARLSELLDSLRVAGLEVKGYAPLLVDFPSMLDGREVLLCWLEGEASLDWYHDPEHGFAGRRRLPD
jgi:hypothetical protein